MKDAEDGSVVLIIGFESFLDVATLLQDFESGALTEHFRPVQDAVRLIPGYEDYTFTVNIAVGDYLQFLEKLGINIISISDFKHFLTLSTCQGMSYVTLMKLI